MKNTAKNYLNAQLVSSIQDTRWIDLGESHRALREYLESAVHSACVEGHDFAPIMVKGAFGIGKTAILHYLFHHSWTVLNVPAFMLNLSDLIDEITKYIRERDIDKLQNKDVSKVLDLICKKQIATLQNSQFDDIQSDEIYFPSFKKSNLKKYLESFHPANCTKASNGQYLEKGLPLFDADVIAKGIHTEVRALVLIDEFEAKYHELKNIIESSGGGLLRDFIEDAASASSTNFFCIIGNGPSSGYEVSRESSAAEARRIIVKQINAPTVKSLSRSFLRDLPHGHINFYWWLSRSRPGQIKKLKESLQPYAAMVENNYIKFLEENKVFDDPIDDMGESNVSFLKTDILENIAIELKDIFKQLLINLEPQELALSEGRKDLLIENKAFFYSSEQSIHIDKVLNTLQSDILKIKDGNYKYKAIKYDKIHYYLDLILESLSDSKKGIAFGALSKGDIEDDLSKTFLAPIFGLLYDFMNIYEDESDDSIKSILDLLLDISNKIENGDVFKHFRKTLDLFEENSVRIDREDKVVIQLSLWAIRNVIEQPIGSPDLSYKSELADELITNIFDVEKIFSFQKDKKNKIIIIPDIDNKSLLKKYIAQVTSHIQDNWETNFNYHNDGQALLTIVYFSESEELNEFRDWLVFKNIEEGIKELPSELRRHNITRFDDYPIHNNQRISTFLNSLCKIGIIGLHQEEAAFSDIESDEIDIESMISAITKPTWTKSKHQKRTIEYYSDLLLNGENSAFSIVISNSIAEYDKKIGEYFRNPKELTSYSYDIHLSDRDHLDSLDWGLSTKNFISHILSDYDQNSYSDASKLLENMHALNLDNEENEDDTKISLRHIGEALNKKLKGDYSSIRESHSESSGNLKSVTRYIELLTRNMNISSVTDYLEDIDNDKDLLYSHFDYLDYSSNKRYFLTGKYYTILTESIDCQVELDTVISEMKDHKNSFAELCAEFEEINEIIKRLFYLKEDLVSPNDINNYTIQVIAKYLLDSEENKSIIHTVIGQIVNRKLSSVLDKMNDFRKQLEFILNSIGPINDEVKNLQQTLEIIYENGKNTPMGDLLKNRFSRSVNKDYLYYNFILRPLKKSDDGDTFNRIFDKTYKPSRKFKIEDQFIQDLNETMTQIHHDRLAKVEEVVEGALEINNQYAETEQVIGYICDIMNYTSVQSNVQIIYQDDEDNPKNGFEKKYSSAMQLKESNPESLIRDIIEDQGLHNSWNNVISSRDKISTLKEFKKYQKQVQKFFATVYERITAPGVLKFTEWVQANDSSKLIADPTIKLIRKTLISEYSDYQEDMDIIAEKINMLDSSNTLFEGVKKQIRQAIILQLGEVDLDVIEEAVVLRDFVSDLSVLLADLGDTPELSFVDSAQFLDDYANEDDPNSIQFKKIISSYSGVIEKIISADDMIIADEDSMQIDMVHNKVKENINDIRNAVEEIFDTGIHNTLDENIHLIFKKFEQAINLDARNASNSLRKEIDTTWDPILSAYNIISQFFVSYDIDKVSSLQQLQENQGLSAFEEVISAYTTRVETILSENPISGIKTNKINELFRSFTQLEASIGDLAEIRSKKEFCESLAGFADEYATVKVPILEKLRVDQVDITSILDLLPSLRQHIENVQSEDPLLTGLSEYYEYIIKKIDQINKKYAEILETSSAHDALPFFNDIPEEGKAVDADSLAENFEMIKTLAQYDLIKINIDKSV